MADEVYGFDEASVRKLVENYRQQQRTFRNELRRLEAKLDRHASDFKPARIYVCKAEEDIDAQVVTEDDVTPGSGKVRVFEVRAAKLYSTEKLLDVLNTSPVLIREGTFVHVTEELATRKFIVEKASSIKWAVCVLPEGETSEDNPCGNPVREPTPSLTGHDCPWLYGAPCDNCNGDNADTENPIILTLPTRQCFDFSLRKDDVVAYETHDDGTNIIVTDTSLELHHAVFTEDMTLGGSAEGELLCQSADGLVSTGTAIRIHDSTNDGVGAASVYGHWRAKTGYRCIVKRRCTGEVGSDGLVDYDIIWCESASLFVQFILLGSLAGGTASAQLTGYSKGVPPVAIGGTITVEDTGGFYTRSPAGAVGYGFHDDIQDRWIVMLAQSTAGGISFNLIGTFTGTVGSGSVVGWWGSQQDVLEPASTVVLSDPMQHFRNALDGAGGVATFDSFGDVYIVTELDSKAGFIEGELDTDRVAGSGGTSATVLDFFGTQQDIQYPGAGGTGGDINVADNQDMYPHALEGAKCVAGLDGLVDIYRMFNCQQMVQRISGTLPSSLAPCGLLTATTSFTIDAEDCEPITFSPFNQMPTGTLTIHDPFSSSAAVGAYWKAEWHEGKQRWELYQIDARCEDPPPEDC